MINADEAREIILRSVEPLETTTVSLERSPGYVLAEEIVSGENIPLFDNAQMDGYAARSEDVGQVPCNLTVVGEVAAGSVAARELQRGEAMGIMTGAKIPKGCDVVVQQEWAEVTGTAVRILRPVSKGHNIRKAGSDITAGSTVFTSGQSLRPQEIGLLASLGERYVTIYRPVTVALLPTGNEIVEINKPLKDGSVRNSNAYTLEALVRKSHGEAQRLEVAADDRGELRKKILEGLRYDMLITTGGVSVGKYDLVMEVLKEVGVEIKFWKVNIKPGMPLLFGMYGGKPVFGLPGNPVSAMVTYLQFVKPALMKMMGHNVQEPSLKLRARLEHEVKKADGKRHFMRAILESKDGTLVVRSTGAQVSNMLSSLTKANCFMIIPEEKELLHAGEEVDVELL